MVEIERKFLVQSQEFIHLATHHEFIAQGFLSVDPARVVRVRVLNTGGKLTVKGNPAQMGRAVLNGSSLCLAKKLRLFLVCVCPVALRKLGTSCPLAHILLRWMSFPVKI